MKRLMMFSAFAAAALCSSNPTVGANLHPPRKLVKLDDEFEVPAEAKKFRPQQAWQEKHRHHRKKRNKR